MWNKHLFDGLRARPLLSLALCLSGGILAVELLRGTALPLSYVQIALILSGAALLLCLLTRCSRWQALLPLAVALGLLLAAGQYAALDAWTYQDGDIVLLQGKVTESWATERGYGLRLRLDSADDRPLRCSPVIVYISEPPPLIGSRVEIEAQCFELPEYHNSGAFSYTGYLRQQGVAATLSTYYGGSLTLLRSGSPWRLGNLAAWLRSRFEQAAAALPEERRELERAVFLGESSGIADSRYESMRLSGVLHVFSVSGLHVGYIAAFAALLGGKGYRHRRRRFYLTELLLLLYLAVTGLASSLIRAAVVSLVVLAADVWLSDPDPPSSLALAAIVCLLIRPLWLFSAGFQLTFAAAWGLAVLSPLLAERLPRGRLWRWLPAAVGASLATLPLLAYYFNSVSWLGWLLSPLAVLTSGIAVILGFIALLLSVLSPGLAAVLLSVGGWAMELLARASEWLSAQPVAASQLATPPLWLVLLFYLVLLVLPQLLEQRGLLRSGAVTVAAIALFVLYPGLTGLPSSDGELEQVLAQVEFLDVGQGDCALIRTADGKTALIDGGGLLWDPGSIGENVLLPYLRRQNLRRIDLIISSHPDADHCDGLLSVLDSLEVGWLLYADCFPDSALQEQLLSAAEENGCVLTPVAAGCVYQLGQYLRISVLSPAADTYYEDENDRSLVTELSCGSVDFLFTGDASATALLELAASDVEAEVVKIPHHGSYSGYCPEFYQAVAAQAVVISVGAKNSYGHPAAAVVEYWQDKAALFRTDQDGAITFYTDGEKWTAHTEKQE